MPDFKTIASFRKDNIKAIRRVCRRFLVLCQQLGLIGENLIAIDGSKFKAVNNRDRNFTSAKLKRRMEEVESSINRYLATSQFCETAAVVYDYSPSRAGEHARNFLQGWKGKLVCDDFGGYKASFELGVTEIGCMAHARRKFFELHTTNKIQFAEQALRYIQLLYEIESEIRDLQPDLRCRIRQEKAVPVMDMLHAWMIAQRGLVPEGSAISRALDYSLKRWAALSHYLSDGAVPIDNNWAENQIRPWALGRKNWLFAGRY